MQEQLADLVAFAVLCEVGSFTTAGLQQGTAVQAHPGVGESVGNRPAAPNHSPADPDRRGS